MSWGLDHLCLEDICGIRGLSTRCPLVIAPVHTISQLLRLEAAPKFPGFQSSYLVLKSKNTSHLLLLLFPIPR